MAVIDCMALAVDIKKSVACEVDKIKNLYGIIPAIATVIVGNDPSSLLYVSKKYEEANKVGISAHIIRLSEDVSETEIRQVIEELNIRSDIHAILLQLPLPRHLNKFRIINLISPQKDVDGLTFVNAGKVSAGYNEDCIIPCTPQGCVAIANSVQQNLTGSNALVVGRSNLVGKPLAAMLLNLGCTVSIAHSGTLDISRYTKNADLLFVATGIPGLITGKMLKEGAIVVDVGISRVGKRVVGDCDFESCNEVAGFITPVPGGVGPMTIAYLLHNTIICCLNLCKQS